MRSPGDLWEAIGSINEEETHHVLTKLYSMYEQMLEKDGDNREALTFFKNLDLALTQTEQCNFNRR